MLLSECEELRLNIHLSAAIWLLHPTLTPKIWHRLMAYACAFGIKWLWPLVGYSRFEEVWGLLLSHFANWDEKSSCFFLLLGMTVLVIQTTINILYHKMYWLMFSYQPTLSQILKIAEDVRLDTFIITTRIHPIYTACIVASFSNIGAVPWSKFSPVNACKQTIHF